MKILLIHSDGVEVVKNKEATSNPQEFQEDFIKMDGLVLVAYVSVEDQDTYDTDLIAEQGAKVIEDAIILITGFPESINEKNEEIRKYNKKIEDGKLVLSWSPVAGVQYNTYARHNSQKDWIKLNKTPIFNNSMKFKKPKTNGLYHFCVSSFDGTKESKFSKEVMLNVK